MDHFPAKIFTISGNSVYNVSLGRGRTIVKSKLHFNREGVIMKWNIFLPKIHYKREFGL